MISKKLRLGKILEELESCADVTIDVPVGHQSYFYLEEKTVKEFNELIEKATELL